MLIVALKNRFTTYAQGCFTAGDGPLFVVGGSNTSTQLLQTSTPLIFEL